MMTMPCVCFLHASSGAEVKVCGKQAGSLRVEHSTNKLYRRQLRCGQRTSICRTPIFPVSLSSRGGVSTTAKQVKLVSFKLLIISSYYLMCIHNIICIAGM